MDKLEITFGNFTITTDKSKMDVDAIHDFLSKYSGWSDNIPFGTVKTSIENSLNLDYFIIKNKLGLQGSYQIFQPLHI